MTKVRFPRTRVLLTLKRVTADIFPAHVRSFAWVGSFRRGKARCGDADLLVAPRSGALLDVLRDLGDGFYGAVDFMFFTLGGVPVNVFVCEPEYWGSALQYTTGSMEHNLAVRAYAKRRGLLVNQFGVFTDRGKGPRLPGSSETETGFYAALDLRWPRPAMRERRNGGSTGIFPMNELPVLHRLTFIASGKTESPGNRATGGTALDRAPAGASQPADQRRMGRR